jgi:transposase InsO family protein
VVEYINDHYGVTRRRACRLVRLHRSAFYYRSVKDPKLALRGRMREIARTRVRYGYRRIHVLLRREGWTLGRNQAYRALHRGDAATAQQTAEAAQDARDATGEICTASAE